MKDIKREDLDRADRKILEHLEDALTHLTNSKINNDDKTAISEYLVMAGERLAKAVRS